MAETTGVALVKTFGAILLSLVVFIVVQAVISILYGLFLSGITVLRPGIIQVMAGVFGVIGGMLAAKSMCDSWLRGYSPQAVFIIFAILSLLAGINYIFFVPFDWDNIPKYVVTVALPWAAFAFFWKDEKIS